MHNNRIYPVEKLIGTVSIQIYFISLFVTYKPCLVQSRIDGGLVSWLAMEARESYNLPGRRGIPTIQHNNPIMQ